MLAGTPRVVTKRGVRVDGRVYNSAELCGHVGETVEVRYMPHHDDVVEIFVGGQHLGTAQLVDRMSPAEVGRLLERRVGEARWLASVQREAARRRRTRYAAMTEPGPMHLATAFVESEAAEPIAGYQPGARRLTGSRSLADVPDVPDRMVRPHVVRGRAR